MIIMNVVIFEKLTVDVSKGMARGEGKASTDPIIIKEEEEQDNCKKVVKRATEEDKSLNCMMFGMVYWIELLDWDAGWVIE
jgi:hypothetical protein